MRNRLFLFFLLFCTTFATAQMELGTYFQTRLFQSAQLNPAHDIDGKWSIALPSSYGMFHQRGFTVSNVLTSRTVNFLRQAENQLMGAFELAPLGISYKHNNLRFSLENKYKIFSDIQFSNPLLGLLVNGNSSIIGGSLDVSPEWMYQIYSETSLGLAYIGKFSAGAKVKFLNGHQSLNTERSKFNLSVNDDIYQIKIEGDYLINSSFPVDFRSAGDFNVQSISLFPANYGLAIDLGIHYKSGPFEFSASALDLGFLNWKENVYNYAAEGEFVYDGVEWSDITSGDFKFLDTIGGFFDFNETNNSFNQYVPARFYAGMNYKIDRNWKAGALFYGHRNQERTNAAVAVNLTRNFRQKHALALQYAVVGTNFLNIGLSAYTTLGPFQLYAITDNFLGFINPLGMQNSNLRIGMNLIFNKSNKV